MRKILIRIIEIYQKVPLESHRCGYYPSCSEYGKIALEEHGTIKGIYLIIKRIIKCNPFNKNIGIDLVPLKKKP